MSPPILDMTPTMAFDAALAAPRREVRSGDDLPSRTKNRRHRSAACNREDASA
jgi:hypothetical protein